VSRIMIRGVTLGGRHMNSENKNKVDKKTEDVKKAGANEQKQRKA
jgi:hypothetical protein